MKAVIAISGLLVLATAALARGQDGEFEPREPALKQPGHLEWAWDGKDALGLAAPAFLHYSPQGTPRIVVTGPDELLAHVQVGQGRIILEPGWHYYGHDRLQVTVTGITVHNIALSGSGVAELDKLDLDHLNLAITGSGSATVAGRSDQLSLGLSGSGRADITHLQAREASVSITGSGSVTGSGRSDHLNLAVSGSGHADLGQLELREANIHIAGSGKAEVTPRDAANVVIAGSGIVHMNAHPAHLTQSITGSGRVRIDGN